jgi:hypothetical protein
MKHESGARSQEFKRSGVVECWSCGSAEFEKRRGCGAARTPESWLLFLEFFVEMSAGAEVAIGNLKDLRGDRPWIIVVQTKH